MNETNFSDESILKLIKLPDLLSVLNALLGFVAILFVLRKANASAIENALVLILAAAVVDGLDGVVARKIGCSPIGKYLDSLADMVSFGVAPAIVTYVLLNDYLHVYAYAYITLAFCGAYVISGMLRLARFDAKPFLCGAPPHDPASPVRGVVCFWGVFAGGGVPYKIFFLGAPPPPTPQAL